MSSKVKAQGLFDSKIIAGASIDALRKLDPRAWRKNSVIFVTEVVSLMVTLFFIRDLVTHNGTALFSGQIAAWLWFTVLFANFAEAVAEGRGKARADALRRTRSDTRAKRYIDPENLGGVVEGVNALDLRLGDVVLVEAGEVIPGDGEILEGVAFVNESAITGKSAPVIREAGGDRSAVTGGTTVLSDFIKVRIDRRAGLDLHRPDDRVGRGRRTAEDAERIGAVHSAGRADHHFPDCLRHSMADRQIFREPVRDCLDRAARLPHPDDDRRASVGHRHRRHGSAGPENSTSLRPPAVRSRRRATSIRCCSTRPARSRSAIAWRPSSCRSTA